MCGVVQQSVRHKGLGGKRGLPSGEDLTRRLKVDLVAMRGTCRVLGSRKCVRPERHDKCCMYRVRMVKRVGRRGRRLRVLPRVPRRVRSKQLRGTTLSDFPCSLCFGAIQDIVARCKRRLLCHSPGRNYTVLQGDVTSCLLHCHKLFTRPRRVVVKSKTRRLCNAIIHVLKTSGVCKVRSPSCRRVQGICRKANTIYRVLPVKRSKVEDSILTRAETSILRIAPFRDFPSKIATAVKGQCRCLR